MKYVLVEKSVISFYKLFELYLQENLLEMHLYSNSRFVIVYVGGFVVSEKTTTSDTGARHISNLRGWCNDFG